MNEVVRGVITAACMIATVAVCYAALIVWGSF